MALNLNGTTQYCNMAGTQDTLNGVSASVFMAWVTIGSVTGTRNLFFFSTNSSGGTARVRLGLVANQFVVAGRRTDGETLKSFTQVGTVAITTTPQHIVAVYDYTNNDGFFYLNGVLNTSDLTFFDSGGSTTASNAVQNSVGARDSTPDQFYQGIVYDARVYINRVLTANEIETIYNARGSDGIIQNLRHRYLFTEAAVGASPATIFDDGDGGVSFAGNRNLTTIASPVIAEDFITSMRIY